MANREANRALARASTSGGSGGSMGTLLIWSAVAVVVALAIIVGAFFLTRPPAAAPGASPIAPTVVTPASIPASGRVLGYSDAPVKVVAWEDFRCTFCFDFTMNVEPKLVTNYAATHKITIEYKDYFTIDLNQNNHASRDAANAAWCAADQGKFWTMHDWLFTNQSPREDASAFSQDRLLQLGQLAGLDMNTFKPCVQQGSHLADITTEEAAVPTDVSNTGTPSIMVNGKLVTAPATGNMDDYYTAIAAAIDAAANPSASPAPSASASAAPTSSASAGPTATVAPTASPS
jgi:protein-disulfide isomerase